MRPKTIDNDIMTSNVMLLSNKALESHGTESIPERIDAATEIFISNNLGESPRDFAEVAVDGDDDVGRCRILPISSMTLERVPTSNQGWPSLANLRAIQMQLPSDCCQETCLTIL